MTAALPRTAATARPPRSTTRPGTHQEATLYLGRQTDNHPHRHLSVIPLLPGLEAMCGRPLAATSRPLAWSQAIALATCPSCRDHAGKHFTSTIR